MAYRSVEQGLADLLVSGVVEEIGERPRRLAQLSAEHRLGPSLAALFRSEGDFFPALRIALRTVAGQTPAGLLSVAITGAVAGGSEAPGEPLELVVVAEDARGGAPMEHAIRGACRRNPAAASVWSCA